MGKRSQVAGMAAQSMRGFTLTELLVVMATTGILFSLALPVFNDWRNNIVYRQAARSIILALRETRSKAITTNHEHRFELDAANKMYRITQGNRSSDSTEWTIIARDWAPLPKEVLVDINVSSIQMNTNGTANGGTIKILDLTSKTKYEVKIHRTGRIRTA